MFLHTHTHTLLCSQSEVRPADVQCENRKESPTKSTLQRRDHHFLFPNSLFVFPQKGSSETKYDIHLRKKKRDNNTLGEVRFWTQKRCVRHRWPPHLVSLPFAVLFSGPRDARPFNFVNMFHNCVGCKRVQQQLLQQEADSQAGRVCAPSGFLSCWLNDVKGVKGDGCVVTGFLW